MSLGDDYRKKICSLQDAVSVVKSGDRVYVSGNAASQRVQGPTRAQSTTVAAIIKLTSAPVSAAMLRVGAGMSAP